MNKIFLTAAYFSFWVEFRGVSSGFICRRDISLILLVVQLLWSIFVRSNCFSHSFSDSYFPASLIEICTTRHVIYWRHHANTRLVFWMFKRFVQAGRAFLGRSIFIVLMLKKHNIVLILSIAAAPLFTLSISVPVSLRRRLCVDTSALSMGGVAKGGDCVVVTSQPYS